MTKGKGKHASASASSSSYSVKLKGGVNGTGTLLIEFVYLG